MRQSQLQELYETLDSYSSHLLGKYPHRYVAFDLERSCNRGLREMLLEDGYWTFAPSRSQKLVYYHQVVAFYAYGQYLPAGYGDRVEVHHINGNSLDNRAGNLDYLTPYEHAVVTRFQRRWSKKNYRKFFNDEAHDADRGEFNKRGARVKDWAARMRSIILRTVWDTIRSTPVLRTPRPVWVAQQVANFLVYADGKRQALMEQMGELLSFFGALNAA